MWQGMIDAQEMTARSMPRYCSRTMRALAPAERFLQLGFFALPCFKPIWEFG